MLGSAGFHGYEPVNVGALAVGMQVSPAARENDDPVIHISLTLKSKVLIIPDGTVKLLEPTSPSAVKANLADPLIAPTVISRVTMGNAM